MESIVWPNGAKVAVAISFDVDSESSLFADFPDTAHKNVGTTSFMRYDSVAIPNILKLYRKHEIKQTFFMPAWTMERYPELVEVILADGHEIAAHGYIHETPGNLSAEDQEYWIKRSIDTHVAMTGKRPRGFRAPSYSFTDQTARILGQEEFLYDSSLMADHVPYVLQTEGRELIEIPTHFAMDDWPQFGHFIDMGYLMPINSAARARELYLEEFDAAWENGSIWVSVWHPFVSGRPARLNSIDKMITYMKEKGDVWFATLEQIAEHVAKSISEGSVAPNRVILPYYDAPLDLGR